MNNSNLQVSLVRSQSLYHLKYTVKPRYKVPQYNRNLDKKEVFVSTEDWRNNFTA